MARVEPLLEGVTELPAARMGSGMGQFTQPGNQGVLARRTPNGFVSSKTRQPRRLPGPGLQG